MLQGLASIPMLSPAHALALYNVPAIASLWTKGRAEAAEEHLYPRRQERRRKEVRIFDLQARAKGLERIRFDPAQKDSP